MQPILSWSYWSTSQCRPSHPSGSCISHNLSKPSRDFDDTKFIERATAQWENEHADELAAQQADYFALVDGKEGADV